MSSEPRVTTSFGLVFARFFWIMLGPLFMLLATFSIVKGGGWFTAADAIFLVLLACVLLARWVEFRGGNPLTATGDPATPAHLRRYVIAAGAIGLATWLVANVIGNHVLA